MHRVSSLFPSVGPLKSVAIVVFVCVDYFNKREFDTECDVFPMWFDSQLFVCIRSFVLFLGLPCVGSGGTTDNWLVAITIVGS